MVRALPAREGNGAHPLRTFRSHLRTVSGWRWRINKSVHQPGGQQVDPYPPPGIAAKHPLPLDIARAGRA